MKQSEREFTLRVLGKYFKTSNREVLEFSYNAAVSLFQEIPYPTIQGIQSTLDFLRETDIKAKQASPKDFIDNSLLEEIERAGVKSIAR